MDKNLNILIVDDDLLIAEMLKEMLLELDYSVGGVAQSYEEAAELLQTEQPYNMAILDINLMQDKSGLDLAALLNEKYQLPFLFLTSYSDTKMVDKALDYKPKAYLIKPFSKIDLYTTIEIIRRKLDAASERAIVIKEGSLNLKLNHSSILYIKSENVYVEVVTAEKQYLLRQSLEKFLESLNDSRFIRIHRSYAVNLDAIQAINGQFVMIQHEMIPISRNIKDELLLKFGK